MRTARSGSVAVVGGGIAGRALARVLVRGGLECTVLERRAARGADQDSALGMGLNLPGNATRALRDLGVLEPVLERGRPVLRREYRNRRGRLLFTTDDAALWRDVGPPTCVRHGHLIAALTLPEGADLEHAEVVSVRPTPGGVEVLTADGSEPRRWDLVVGADGVHSRVRAAVTDEAPRRSAMSASSWRFVGENPGVADWTAWSGRDATALLIPLPHDQVYGYVSHTRGGGVGAETTWLTRTAAGFGEPVPDAVARAVAHGLLHHGPVEELRLGNWHRDRVLLIGDAAHATGPVWAQGAALALEDALVLGLLLAATPPARWHEVGDELRRLRLARVRHVQEVTDEMSRVAALPSLVRDVAAPVLGPRSFRRAYTPLREPCLPRG